MGLGKWLKSNDFTGTFVTKLTDNAFGWAVFRYIDASNCYVVKIMSFEQHLDRAHALLLSKGFLPASINPIVYRLARKAGLKVPPPQFCTFSVNTLLGTLWFGTLWGVIMWVMQWQSLGVSIWYATNASLITGLFFGLMMASWYKLAAKRKQLPAWQAL